MVQRVCASIVSSSRLNDTIWRYVLKPEHFVPYQAGQYLRIHRPEADSYYSIANAPVAAPYYDLHVRHRSLSLLWDSQQTLSLSLPYGICDVGHLHTNKPILFIAVGTGFSPIRAMIEQLLYRSDPRHFELYWGVAVGEDLYDQESLQRWQLQRPSFRFVPHISSGRQDALIALMIEQHPDLKDWQIVMAGPFDLMYVMQAELMQHGVDKQAIFSDAFEFA